MTTLMFISFVFYLLFWTIMTYSQFCLVAPWKERILFRLIDLRVPIKIYRAHLLHIEFCSLKKASASISVVISVKSKENEIPHFKAVTTSAISNTISIMYYLDQRPPIFPAPGTGFGKKMVFHGSEEGWFHAHNSDPAHAQIKLHWLTCCLRGPVPNRLKTVLWIRGLRILELELIFTLRTLRLVVI